MLTATSDDGYTPLTFAIRRIRRLCRSVKRREVLSMRAFDELVRFLDRLKVSLLDRQYAQNQVRAAAVYLVEAPGTRGYFPQAGMWHLKQAWARLRAGPTR